MATKASKAACAFKCSSDASISKDFCLEHAHGCSEKFSIESSSYNHGPCCTEAQALHVEQPWPHATSATLLFHVTLFDLLLNLAHAEFETEEHHHPCPKPHQKSHGFYFQCAEEDLSVVPQSFISKYTIHEGPSRSYVSSMKIHKQRILK